MIRFKSKLKTFVIENTYTLKNFYSVDVQNRIFVKKHFDRNCSIGNFYFKFITS